MRSSLLPIAESGFNRHRALLIILSLPLLLLTNSSCLVRQLGGAFSHEPEELEKGASAGAKRLIDQAFEGIDPQRLVDYHTHIVGLGTNGSGASVNAQTMDGLSLERLKFSVFASAAGIQNIAQADEEYVSRLVRLARGENRHGKYRILALDRYYREDGSIDSRKTTFYVPNEYIFRLARDYPDVFLPVISVHPYRADALAELKKWAREGAKYVKWLPNAMGMNPASPRLVSFYRKMKEHDMILLSHTGDEQTVDSAENQSLGNPLLLRQALDLGIRVIMAHTASLGTCEDIRRPEKPKAPCFDLALGMMDEQKYGGLLFGEISAQLQFNRVPAALSTLLKRQDLHRRLINGSDYPLPAINLLIRTRDLARDGFITHEERRYLNEIYNYNPLLFDFVLKRTVRHPETKQKLSPIVFMANPGLEA